MQIITVTRSALFSEFFTPEMLVELGSKYLGMSDEALAKLATATLSKPSKDLANLSHAKLRTAIATKLGNSPDYGETFNAGQLQLDFDCLPDLDMGKAGSNTRRPSASGSGKRAPAHSGSVPKEGSYKVVKRPASPSVNGGHAGKWEIWQHIWTCSSFEEFFAKCPAKAVKSDKSIITASSEMRWALKQGWIAPVEAAPAE